MSATPPAVEEFFASQPPPICDLALQTCAFVRGIMPDAIEEVHPGRNNVIYSSTLKMSDWICYVSPFRDHINLGFLKGAVMPDRQGLLDGTGKMIRHVKIRSVQDLDNPALRMLIEAARSL